MTSVQESPAPSDTPPPTHELRILNVSGDTRINWDPDDRDSVRIAKAAFDDAVGRGYWAYTVDKDAKKTSERVKDFDSKMESIILAPRMAGG